MFRPFLVLSVLFFSLNMDVCAHAQDGDAVAPSLAVDSDQDAPWQRFALTADIAGPIFSEYTLSAHVMPSRFAGLRVTGGFRTQAESRAFMAELSADVRPLGRSFDGPLIALGASFETGAVQAYGVSVEGGYAFTWRSLLFEASLGARWNTVHGWSPRVRAAVGLAF